MKMICDMHNEAMAAVGEIQSWVNDAQNVEFDNLTESILTDWIDFISNQAWVIEKAVTEAKQAGIRMERGLSTKRDRINELESLSCDLESRYSGQSDEISNLEGEIERLGNIITSLEERLGRYE